MKKYPLMVFAVIILMLSGCVPKNPSEKKTDVSSFFESVNTSFSARFGKTEAKGLFSFTPERLILKFTYPETVNGLEITADSSCVTLSINDLCIKKENSAVTRSFNAATVFSILNYARLNGLMNKTGGRTTVTGEGFEITLDEENRVSEISAPEKEIYIKLDW